MIEIYLLVILIGVLGLLLAFIIYFLNDNKKRKVKQKEINELLDDFPKILDNIPDLLSNSLPKELIEFKTEAIEKIKNLRDDNIKNELNLKERTKKIEEIRDAAIKLGLQLEGDVCKHLEKILLETRKNQEKSDQNQLKTQRAVKEERKELNNQIDKLESKISSLEKFSFQLGKRFDENNIELLNLFEIHQNKFLKILTSNHYKKNIGENRLKNELDYFPRNRVRYQQALRGTNLTPDALFNVLPNGDIRYLPIDSKFSLPPKILNKIVNEKNLTKKDIDIIKTNLSPKNINIKRVIEYIDHEDTLPYAFVVIPDRIFYELMNVENLLTYRNDGIKYLPYGLLKFGLELELERYKCQNNNKFEDLELLIRDWENIIPVMQRMFSNIDLLIKRIDGIYQLEDRIKKSRRKILKFLNKHDNVDIINEKFAKFKENNPKLKKNKKITAILEEKNDSN